MTRRAAALVALKWDRRTGEARSFKGVWPDADEERRSGGFHNRQPTRARMFSGAGMLWLFLDSVLYRFNPMSDEWTAEGARGRFATLFSVEPGAIWLRERSDVSVYPSGRGDGDIGLYRWTPDTGWQRPAEGMRLPGGAGLLWWEAVLVLRNRRGIVRAGRRAPRSREAAVVGRCSSSKGSIAHWPGRKPGIQDRASMRSAHSTA